MLCECHPERSEESQHGAGEDAAEGFNQKAWSGVGCESVLGCAVMPRLRGGMELEVVK